MPTENLLPLHPAERPVYELLGALPKAKARQLVEFVQRQSKRRNLYYKKQYSPFGLVPFVLERETVPTLRALAASIFRFQLQAPRLWQENYKGFSDLIILERRTKAWFERTPVRAARAWELLIRPDFALKPGPDGHQVPVLFELNSLMLGGMYIHGQTLQITDQDVLPSLGLPARKLGVKAAPDNVDYLARFLKRARAASGAGRLGGVAMIESLPAGGGFSELPDLTRLVRAAGVEARHGDARDLEQRKDGVYLKGMKVGFVYRDFSFEDVGGPGNPRLKVFEKLWDEGRVTPGLASDFDQKGILECFTSSEFDGLFSRSEVKRFRAHVPWTRVLAERRTEGLEGKKVDLPKYALKNQERLVLKPSWGSGGEGILLGWKVSPKTWKRGVERGLAKKGSYAVQQYIDVPKRTTGYVRDGKIHRRDCRSTLGVFFDGAEYAYHGRVSSKDIVNVAQGGAMSPIYLEK